MRRRSSRFGGWAYAGPAAPTDPLIALVKFGVNFTGTNGSTAITDYATGKTVSVNGSAKITTSTSAFGVGSCMDLSVANHIANGSAYLTVPDSADWTPGASEDFCWEVIIDTQTGTGGTQDIVNHANGSGAYPYRLYRSGGGALGLLSFDSSPSLDGNDVSGSISTGFKHLAFRRIGSTIYTSIDGVTAGTLSGIGSARFDSNGDLNIGAYNATTSGVGYIQAIRYTKGSARYTAGNFTPPSALFPTS